MYETPPETSFIDTKDLKKPIVLIGSSPRIKSLDVIGAPLISLNVSKDEFIDESFFLSDKEFVMNHNKNNNNQKSYQFNFAEEMNMNNHPVLKSI